MCLQLILLLAIPCILHNSLADDRQTYIIHMDALRKPDTVSTHHDWYISLLVSLPDTLPTHLYTYNHVTNGFSASLSQSHLEHLARVPGFLSAQHDSYGQLHTTSSPEFLGLGRGSGLWPASRYGEDVVIGIVDSGIWPESRSFDDTEMPPVPTRWRGGCDDVAVCNRKIIGARVFSKGIKMMNTTNITEPEDYNSARDYVGHGTHTSSTAAGTLVRGISYFGYAEGTATGIAPMARISMYKALFADGAAASDVLAAMDAAIADGVDVMSLSLGFYKTPYYDDVVAIGAFAAMEKGIFVSCSAGNGGPHEYTVINGAPWLMSVGAGTIDRDYFAIVSFSGMKIEGRSLYPENLFVSNVSLFLGNTCEYQSLNATAVSEKIVLCLENDGANVFTQIQELNRVGTAKGAILITDMGQYLTRKDFFMPFVAVSLADGEVIKKSRTDTVDITFISTKINVTPAPQVVYFSSRGPSRITPDILKPDILAPGRNILAAWAPNTGFAPIHDDYLSTDYALASGTSMASPHIIGIAAMLRSLHRDWSPAAIRSAMMTTADTTDNSGNKIIDMITSVAATPLDYGGGHVNPNKAMDPGLIYDISAHDYVNYICALNYSSAQIQTITRSETERCDGNSSANLDLNYPSFAIILETNVTSRVFRRVLTNVGGFSAKYRAEVDAAEGMEVVVEPEELWFEGEGAKREFLVRVDIDLDNVVREEGYFGNYGFLSWVEIGGKHVVKSPIVSAFAP